MASSSSSSSSSSLSSSFRSAVTALICICILSTEASMGEVEDVHDLLPLFNLPKGLLPMDIKSYSLSPSDGSFRVELSSHPCYVHFDANLVYYDKIITGKLGLGKVTEVSGIQAKKLFLWVSVTAIAVDGEMIEFRVGALSQKFPVEDFQDVPPCSAKALQLARASSI
ncbi:uncharacterized protein LOC127251646 [Andrographis paniculata]|uniref:uncharacterized protein LOC127251646 n=1 Tax=Andrographis paniculata TaxID=175694 RepID=UPI0021E7A627|nr:uncharacterized protein LOC127251646 [Andrographis paniculata]